MPVSDHARLEELGLLAGPLDPATRRAWPTWARAHAETCPDCANLITADRTLTRVFSTEAPAATPPPPPSLAALRSRRPPDEPGIEVLAALHTPFPSGGGAFRSASLQVVRHAGTVTAFDPTARHLALFFVPQSGVVSVLGEARTPTAGARVERTLRSDRRGVVVAVAVADELDPGLWTAWLAANPISGLDQPDVAARVHVVTVAVGLHQLPPLRIQPALPPVQPAVLDGLEAARELGRTGRDREATSRFLDVRDLAEAAGDLTGRVQATLGVASGLVSLGFHEDARAVLLGLAAAEVLDPAAASRLCRAMAWSARLADELAEADAWIVRGRQLQPDSAWYEPLERSLAFARRDGVRVLRAVASATREATEAVRFREAQATIARCWLGQTDGELPAVSGEIVEVRLWQLAARATVERARTGRWPSALEPDLLRELESVGRSPLSHWDSAPIAHLAASVEPDDPWLAARLLDARYLTPARSPGVLLLATDRGEQGVRVSVSGQPARTVRIGAAELTAAVADLRAAVVLERPTGESERLLRALLLPQALPAGARLVVGTHALLEGLPWPLLLQDEPGVAVVEALGRGAGCLVSPGSARVASLANPTGDLPLAEHEGRSADAGLRFVGAQATSQALANLGEVGLLHLGTHVDRRDGVPELRLADRAVSAVELGRQRLDGGPVVLLAGCASADSPRTVGVERSLAGALLAAGASAVVATRWPLRDGEAHLLFRPFVEAWPFADVESTFATIVATLREAGVAPRVWAAAALYRA